MQTRATRPGGGHGGEDDETLGIPTALTKRPDPRAVLAAHEKEAKAKREAEARRQRESDCCICGC